MLAGVAGAAPPSNAERPDAGIDSGNDARRI